MADIALGARRNIMNGVRDINVKGAFLEGLVASAMGGILMWVVY